MSYAKLKQTFKRLSHLSYIQRVLSWDEAVMMPEGAGEYRASASATLSGVIQKNLSNKKVKTWFDSAKSENSLSPWNQQNLKLMERNYLQASCLPRKLVEEFTATSIRCEQAWRNLRPQNDWQTFLPFLESNFNLIKEIATRRSEILQISPYDTCIDEFAPGFNQALIDPIFTVLKQQLPNLIGRIILKQESERLTVPTGPFDIHHQKNLGLKVMRALGFNFQHGRLDISTHPFCSGAPQDVRITTRYNNDEFLRSLYGICHETGHALYEQGLPLEWIDQPVGHIKNMAQHESQSLLVEMDVGRSFAFCEFLAPLLQEQFGTQNALTAENVFLLITRVMPSLIRVDADEVTYPMHIIIRYELEKALFNNEIGIADLPAYWNQLMSQYLDLSTDKNYQNGVMQDVHWASGAFGYFPAYTLGRLIAAQIFATFKNHHQHFESEIKDGNFKGLLSWLQENVYSLAASLPVDEWLIKISGKKLDPTFFIDHVEQRYLS
jgi:carboxypeptidase Taq